jgi:hypothetical protein
MYTEAEASSPEMSEVFVEAAMDSKDAQNILRRNENCYAQLSPYNGGNLEARRTGLQVGISYMAAIWENDRIIGYTMKPDEAKNYLANEYEKNKAAAA